MPKFSSMLAVCGAFGLAVVSNIGVADAQSRMAPAGSALAQTPPLDQRAKQFRALPKTQKQFYLHQGYKRHQRPE